MNLAEVDKEKACLAYSKRFGRETVKFQKQTIELEEYYVDDNGWICISNGNFFVKFLNNFGHLLAQVRVCSNRIAPIKQEVFDIVYDRCTTLRELMIANVEDETIRRLRGTVASVINKMIGEPFNTTKIWSTVEILVIDKIYFSAKFKFNQSFPNLRNLQVRSIILEDSSIIEVNLPHLEHLGIILLAEDDDDFTVDFNHFFARMEVTPKPREQIEGKLKQVNIKNLIALNPQLKNLRLNMSMDVSFLQFISDNLPNLDSIMLAPLPGDFNRYSGESISFKTVTEAIFITDDKLPPVSFDNLKKLKIYANIYSNYIHLIKRNRFLTDLHLDCDDKDIEMLDIIRALPDLQHLNVTIEERKWSQKGLNNFLLECERLTTLKISLPQKYTVPSIWKTSSTSDSSMVIEKN